jgi:hypothetical protein
MAKKLFQTHVNHLRKVVTQVAYSQKMDGGTIILGKKNEQKRAKAENLIYQGMILLGEIE